MTDSIKLSSFAIFAAAALLVGCGEQESSAPAGKAEASAPAAAAKKEEVKNPYSATFDAVESDDRSKYLAIEDPLNAVRFYLKNRTWDETADDVAKSLQFSGIMEMGGKITQYKSWVGLDYDLQLASFQYHEASDAFAKRDFASSFNEKIVAEAQKVGDNRLVKFTTEASNLGVGAYNFETSSFTVSSCLFAQEAPTSIAYRSSLRSGECSKAYMGNSLASKYKFGFTNADWLKTLKVEDEQSARAIEKMRSEGKVVIYGYLAEVKRANHVEGDKRVADEERTLEIVPTFVDFLDGDAVVYTARQD